MNPLPNKSIRWLFVVTALGVVVLVATILLSPSIVLTELTDLTSQPLMFALLLCVVYTLRPLLGLPPTPLTILVGFVYGIPAGLVVAQVGTVLTALPLFFAGKAWQTPPGPLTIVSERGEGAVAHLGERRSVLAATLSPAPLDAVAYSAGMVDISFRHYVTYVFLGALPWSIAYVLIGTSLERISMWRSADVTWLVLGLAVGALLLVAPPLYRHFGGQ